MQQNDQDNDIYVPYICTTCTAYVQKKMSRCQIDEKGDGDRLFMPCTCNAKMQKINGKMYEKDRVRRARSTYVQQKIVLKDVRH